jgi:putative N6-adenine-specific DNA methylase
LLRSDFPVKHLPMKGNRKDEGSVIEFLRRRIRRFVQAPVHRFAAVVPPELSPLCAVELRALGIPSPETTEVGIEFSGKLRVCYMANLELRTASRVLCILPSFRAGAVEELFNRIQNIHWELWLDSQTPLRVKAYLEHSRIEHEGLAVDTTVEGIQKRFRSAGLSAPHRWERQATQDPGAHKLPSPEQRIFVHIKKNRGEISLDTTGVHLHFRGYRLQHMGAPLRETLAAAILIKSEWRGNLPLVDGMCGSGTLPIEAALMARALPPGLKRSFLFERWPSFADRTWAFLLRKGKERSIKHCHVPIVAIDRVSQTIAVARENAARAGVGEDIEWVCGDFFEFFPKDRNLPAGLVFLNPPYGKRMVGGDEVLYERLGMHLRRHFSGWRMVVLARERSLAMRLHVESMRFWNIVHGGIPIVAATAKL